MEQKLIIKREDYYEYYEDRVDISNLKMDYRNTHLGIYDEWRKYLHIEVNDYNGFNLYLEMQPWEAEKLFMELAEKARKLNRGYWLKARFYNELIIF